VSLGETADPGFEDVADLDTRRWMRDMGALLALPALWVDHDLPEIATGLLSVLFGVLRLEGGYARFDDPRGGAALETWRPSGPNVPAELALAREEDPPVGSGIATTVVNGLRVTSVPIALPWETGLVVVSAARADFPTVVETPVAGRREPGGDRNSHRGATRARTPRASRRGRDFAAAERGAALTRR
jgi:hypothetical protein